MAGKLTITIGLPASGKSTWAEEQRKLHDDVRVVTRDDLRLAISAVFEAGDEQVVMAVRDTAVYRYLERGYHVIVADTNLDARTQRHFAEIAERSGAEFAKRDFRDVPLNICLARNTVRHTLGDMKVPHEAIVRMHDKFIKPLLTD